MNYKQIKVTYILDVINSESYGITANTEKEKLQFLANEFQRQYLFKNNLHFYGSIENVLKEWYQGLPTCFDSHFYPHDILRLESEWGNPAKTEEEEEKQIENWFPSLAAITMRLFEKHNIKLTVQP